MCGIVGYITDKDQYLVTDLRRYIQQALMADTLRGDDATGVFYAAHKWKNPDTVEGRAAGFLKNNVPGPEFVEDAAFKELLRDVHMMRAMVGHNRSATIGSNTSGNAHPFREGPITLVHNGTAYNTGDMPGGGMAALKVAVDSHAITHNLALHSVDEVISKINGGFALVWHDARDDTINMIRNSERPLHMAQIKNKSAVIFASEGEMLHWIASRSNIPIMPIYTPKPGMLFKFHQDKTLKPEVRAVPLYVAPTYNSGNHSRGRGAYQGGGYYGSGWHDVDYEDAEYGTPADRFRSRNNVPIIGESSLPFVPTTTRQSPRNLAGKVVEGEMQRLGLKAGEIMMFDPVKTMPMPKGPNVMVIGFLHPYGQTAVIYNLPPVVFDRNKSVCWKSKVFGAKWVNDMECVVVCSLEGIASEQNSGNTPSATAGIRKDQDGKITKIDLRHKGAGKRELLFPGPRGSLLRESEWDKTVENGCVACNGVILREFADEIMWVNDRQDPLCPGCIEDYQVLGTQAEARTVTVDGPDALDDSADDVSDPDEFAAIVLGM